MMGLFFEDLKCCGGFFLFLMFKMCLEDPLIILNLQFYT